MSLISSTVQEKKEKGKDNEDHRQHAEINVNLHIWKKVSGTHLPTSWENMAVCTR